MRRGYEDLYDHDRLREGLAMQTVIGKDRTAAANPTLCRFDNRADRAVTLVL